MSTHAKRPRQKRPAPPIPEWHWTPGPCPFSKNRPPRRHTADTDCVLCSASMHRAVRKDRKRQGSDASLVAMVQEARAHAREVSSVE